MRRRHLPKLWLMTDERMGDGLWDALARLPRGGGIVFRHHATPPRERRRLFAQVMRIARRRGLVVVRAGRQAMRGEAGRHNPAHAARRRPGELVTVSAHDRRGIARAGRLGADVVFVSPVFSTRSHPDGRPLGAVRLGLLVRAATVPIIALGGMDARRFRRLRGLGAYGWAGIDAWLKSAAVEPLRTGDLAKPRRQTSLREAGRARCCDAELARANPLQRS